MHFSFDLKAKIHPRVSPEAPGAWLVLPCMQAHRGQGRESRSGGQIDGHPETSASLQRDHSPPRSEVHPQDGPQHCEYAPGSCVRCFVIFSRICRTTVKIAKLLTVRTMGISHGRLKIEIGDVIERCSQPRRYLSRITGPVIVGVLSGIVRPHINARFARRPQNRSAFPERPIGEFLLR